MDRKNLYEANCFLYPVKVAVKNGLLIEIDNEYFAVAETEYNNCAGFNL